MKSFATQSDRYQSYMSCRDNTVKYNLRSDELQQILKADQADRVEGKIEDDIRQRDRKRRMRVGAIFGEGCFREARDYRAAAVIFQHGDQPEHFFQTYIWAKNAVDLGDISAQVLMAEGIDRYLINTNRKQLFATQYFLPSMKADACWCLYETEASFPDELRLKYAQFSYQQSLERLMQLNKGHNCPVVECSQGLKNTPEGSIPGVW